ncbi:hypothetical protein OEB94_00445 [Streptomyces sp. ICN988]|uniref:hypothetical protein n=1 Tax=Streptomyces sp. ICN988 TaxID=2983765 RepID=UPI0021E404A8|nr:hypothetical protein [Streptomyces sp. ICN988]MCV2457773.1 hypothetical protein [Streptomyces sp. ICN988]
MLSHVLEQGVLVIKVYGGTRIDGRATLFAKIGDLIHAYKPTPVVIVLDDSAVGRMMLSVVVRAHRMCTSLGVLMSVASHSAPLRRQLEASVGTDTKQLVIHARADVAISAAAFAAAV